MVDCGKAGTFEKRDEGFRAAGRKTPTFVLLQRRGVERGGGIPEAAHQLHLARIIPHIGGDDAAERTARAISATAFGISGTKLITEPGDGSIGGGTLGGPGRGGLAELENGAGSATVPPRMGKDPSDLIDAGHLRGSGTLQNGAGQNAGATTHIEPAQRGTGVSQSMNARATSRLQRPT